MVENKIYTDSKEDIAQAILCFEKGDKVEYMGSSGGFEVGTLINILPFEQLPYRILEKKGETSQICKLQKPVNKYEALEENGKYKVVEVDSKTLDGRVFITIKDNCDKLSLAVNYKDFDGFVFNMGKPYEFKLITCNPDCGCWHPNYGHAVGVRFKVNKND